MTSAYLNFDLLIDRSPNDGSYRARVIQSPAGEAVSDFNLPFALNELTDSLWRTTSDTRSLSAAPDEASSVSHLQRFGALLYDAVFGGAVGLCLRRSLDEAERYGAGLRIRLRPDAGVLELAELPWEFLFAPDLDRFLALSDLTPIVRYIELDRPVKSLAARLPLTILAVVANPSDAPPLAVEREWQNLQAALDQLLQRGVIALERLETATLPALQARLWRGPVDLLHFVGHGSFDVQSNSGGLVFEKENGRAEIVTAETLGMLLHDHEALRLIFLNACQGAQSGRSDTFAGVAQRLVRQGVPIVLAMQFAVSDIASVTLSQAFYQSLADGLAADTALTEARKALFTSGGNAEWGTPVLYSRSDDNQLIELAKHDRQRLNETAPFEPKTTLISSGPSEMGSGDPAAPTQDQSLHALNLIRPRTVANSRTQAVEPSSADLRGLLMDAFNDEELTTLCFDHFRAVYDDFSIGMSRSQKTQRLLEYCFRRHQVQVLMTLVEQANPAQYRRHQASWLDQ